MNFEILHKLLFISFICEWCCFCSLNFFFKSDGFWLVSIVLFKGIVHVMFICLPPDVGEFVSSVEHKPRFLTQTIAVCQSYNGSQWDSRFERQKNIKPCDSWRYIEVLRHKTIGLCKKLKSICMMFLPLIHRNVQLPLAHAFTTSGNRTSSTSLIFNGGWHPSCL